MNLKYFHSVCDLEIWNFLLQDIMATTIKHEVQKKLLMKYNSSSSCGAGCQRTLHKIEEHNEKVHSVC